MSSELLFRWQILTKFLAREHASTQIVGPRPRSEWRSSRRRVVFWIGSLLMSIGAGLFVRAEIYRRISRYDHVSVINPARSGGTLLIAGGGQLSEMIRQRFIELAGGHAARIVIIPAEATDDESRRQYRDAWAHFDVRCIDVLHANSRSEADNPEVSQLLESATGVWLGGGQQTWLSGSYGQTLVEIRLKQVLSRNGVIGGTSAGAAVMSRVMIAGGREKPTMGRGFDLIPDAVVDQHFLKRNRFSRLQHVLEQHPELIGFGIDEGTALQYGVEKGRFQVLGQSCVVAIVSDPIPEGHSRFHLQILNPGDEFDVERLRRGETVPRGIANVEDVLFGE